jgi:ribose transport system substrate-binding protein
MDIMQNFLTQFPKIDAVWAGDDDVAMGAIRAIRERGRDKEMFVFPGAGMKEIVKMIMDKDPLVPANVTYSPSMIATGMYVCVSSLRDGREKAISTFLPKHLTIDVELITPENAKDYYFPQSVY